MTRRALSLLPALLILLGTSLPVLLLRSHLGRGYYDQANYHWRVVTKFSAELPRPDLSDYVSATTPLYHLVLAVIHRTVTQEVVYHQLFGTLVSLVFLAVVWWFVSRAAAPAKAAVLMLPLACSMYVIDPAIWVLPDNAGWLWVAVLLGTSFQFRLTHGRLALCCVAMALLVLTRQSHVWCAAAIWMAAWMHTDGDGGAVATDRAWGVPITRIRARLPLAFAGLVATLPAFFIAAWFWRLWGGRLTPPVFDIWYTRHSNPSAPAFILSLTAIYSVFFGAYLVPALMDLLKNGRVILLAGALAGGVAGVLPRTNYDLEQGRYGGIWSIAGRLPMVEERSVFIAALSVAGAVAVVCWAAALNTRRRWIFLGCIAAFVAAQSANPWVYQRYAEPFLLMLMIYGASGLGGEGIAPGAGGAGSARSTLDRGLRVARAAGPVVLGALLWAVAVGTYLTAQTTVLLPPGQIDQPPKNPAP